VSYLSIHIFKIHIFLEGPKILQNLHLTFVSYVVAVKSKVEISQNFVAFSEYMNFNPHSEENGITFWNFWSYQSGF
jgi:hypothetical protein